MNSNNWSRRKFTKAVISAQALLASGVLTLPMACAESNKSEGDTPLDNSQEQTLKFAMDEIIPANDKMPSASKVGGVNYILKIVEEFPDLSPLFISLTAKIEGQSLQQAGSAFSKINSEKRIAVLITIEQTEPELFKVLKDFTYESYYTNDTVHELISYEPYPTGTTGPEMEPLDEKLLDRVKNTPSMFTKI
ncbi:MAG: gluconate 2-dehydrogenase subunit 3 family protein [Flavobacteriaceae bacterium]|nr:MAG: gluconate 2-dehydrogenase subunit 3 family protein [Flavobacteriaceae bacterium]